jgi:hypothetical protein
MKSLCIVFALLGQFQVEEFSSTNQSQALFIQEEFSQPKQAIEKPEFELLGASWCGGCQSVKQSVGSLPKSSLPFTYTHHNVDTEGWLGAASIPAWAYKGQIIQYGWSTPEGLMENFRKATSRARSTVQRLSSAQLKAFAHSYNGPDVGVKGGNFWAHLQDSNHGFSAQQLTGLTQWECARIHGAHHYNYLTPFSIGGK